jgi:hypothetical protein
VTQTGETLVLNFVQVVNQSQATLVFHTGSAEYCWNLVIPKDPIIVESIEMEEVIIETGTVEQEVSGLGWGKVSPETSPRAVKKAILRPRRVNGTTSVADVTEFLPPEGQDFKLKLTFPGEYPVDFIGLDLTEQVPLETRQFPLISARHSAYGDVTHELSHTDMNYAELLPGEHIDLIFDCIEPTDGLHRALVLVSTGHYHSITQTEKRHSDSERILPEVSMTSFPNPFNPVTNIQFSLAIGSEWTLTIHNLLGQKVAEFSGYSDAGLVTVPWNASDKASGLYFCKLVSGRLSATRKLLLIK